MLATRNFSSKYEPQGKCLGSPGQYRQITRSALTHDSLPTRLVVVVGAGCAWRHHTVTTVSSPQRFKEKQTYSSFSIEVRAVIIQFEARWSYKITISTGFLHYVTSTFLTRLIRVLPKFRWNLRMTTAWIIRYSKIVILFVFL